MDKPKVLYAVQGTGNGHAARAREIIPILTKYAHVDLLLSSDQSELDLPLKPKYTVKGITFYYSASGGINYTKTLFKNNILRWIKEVKQLPVNQYQLVISDFEGVSAYAAKWRNVKSVSLSHQSSFFSEWAPKPRIKSLLGELILKYYAPTKENVGFHFFSYDNFVHTPVIRREVRELVPENGSHYSVYLPAYSDDLLIKHLTHFRGDYFEVFSKTAQEERAFENGKISPIDSEKYLESFRSCKGLLTSAGFESPSEALFLGKKVAVIPIKGQYEQKCNAAALKSMGVAVFKSLSDYESLQSWMNNKAKRKVNFPDETEEIIKNVVRLAMS